MLDRPTFIVWPGLKKIQRPTFQALASLSCDFINRTSHSSLLPRLTRPISLWQTGLVTWCCVLSSFPNGQPRRTNQLSSGCLASRFPLASSLLSCRHAQDRTTFRWTRCPGSSSYPLLMIVTSHSNPGYVYTNSSDSLPNYTE